MRTRKEEHRIKRRSDSIAVVGNVDEVVGAILLLGLVGQLVQGFVAELSLLLSGSDLLLSPGTYSVSLPMSLSLYSSDSGADVVSEWGGGGGWLRAPRFVRCILL